MSDPRAVMKSMFLSDASIRNIVTFQDFLALATAGEQGKKGLAIRSKTMLRSMYQSILNENEERVKILHKLLDDFYDTLRYNIGEDEDGALNGPSREQISKLTAPIDGIGNLALHVSSQLDESTVQLQQSTNEYRNKISGIVESLEDIDMSNQDQLSLTRLQAQLEKVSTKLGKAQR